MIYVIILIIMTVLGAIASYNFKLASGSDGIASVLKNKYLYIGGVLYLIASLFNIYLLRFLDYSIVLPLTSLTYIWTMIVSFKMLGEKITYRKIAGTILIVSGAIIIGLC